MKNCYPYNMNCNMNCNRSRNECMNNPIAMAYVPMQRWNTLYDPMKALHSGTAFPELDLVFCGRRGR